MVRSSVLGSESLRAFINTKATELKELAAAVE
jgi:hypothetical protein